MVYISNIYILQLLNVYITSCRNLSENQLLCMIKKLLIKGFKTLWYKKREKILMQENLIHTSVLKEFIAGPYLMLEHFYMRKAICKLRLSAHNILIELGRYVKPKSIPCPERIW